MFFFECVGFLLVGLFVLVYIFAGVGGGGGGILGDITVFTGSVCDHIRENQPVSEKINYRVCAEIVVRPQKR